MILLAANYNEPGAQNLLVLVFGHIFGQILSIVLQHVFHTLSV